MADLSSYPPIDPTAFDIIIIGTGLPASILAAATSAAGKTVLHLDPNAFYGSHFASLPLHDLSSFLHSQTTVATAAIPSSSPLLQPLSSDCGDYVAVQLTSRPLYSCLDISSHSSEPLELSRKFNLDLVGPRALFCADTSVDLMLKSGASQYVEFKSVDASFVWDPEESRFSSVPDSRAAIFKDRRLTLAEKNQLMRFFKLVEAHLASEYNSESSRISEVDLESPFVEFLKKMRLSPKIKSIILYAIAMANYDQDSVEVCKDMLNTKDGIARLALYSSSAGRFQNALGSLLYPIYGQGELPQAFCRCAAVKGCLYVLRMPVIALLMDEGDGHYKGVKLASGQDLFSQNLVLDPSFTVHWPLTSNPGCVQESPSLKDSIAKVARAICVTRSSLMPDLSNFLLIYPPKSLYPEQVTSIRALQIGSNLVVCPSGMFVLYLSALCDDADEGKKLLHTTIRNLFTHTVSGNAENSSSIQIKNVELKPTLLWSALYIQELTMGSFESVYCTPMPDGNLNYDDVIDATKKLFHKMYPHEEFFPEATSPGNSEDDGRFSLEP
ncbi:rab escort protein 1 isoform X2 [Malania oleifera]|uniref:rab escort protein 1 isoform X2 n=1 Tax=Malania oleifera TaxID=397392 RepID=UPI0025ADBA56|nr:rab escort protein 1 isoform X2 [Malania oleifera]